jgi:hypothetical protein
MKSIQLAVGLSCLSVCGFTTSEPDLEQLLGVTVNDQGITFQVASNGCTTKDNFSFNVVEILEPLSPMLPAMEHHHYITVSRNSPDLCEEFAPYGTQIFMSFDELSISFGKFHIKNPIGGDKIQVNP